MLAGWCWSVLADLGKSSHFQNRKSRVISVACLLGGKPVEIAEAPRLIYGSGIMIAMTIFSAASDWLQQHQGVATVVIDWGMLRYVEYVFSPILMRFLWDHFFDIAGCLVILRLQFLIFNAWLLCFGRLFGGTELGFSSNTRSPCQQNLVVAGCMQLSVFTSLKWQNVWSPPWQVLIGSIASCS